MKNQTLSIERMLHLKKLGVDTSKASMCWLKAKKDSICQPIQVVFSCHPMNGA